MNPRHSKFSTLITATVFAVALSLLHVANVFAGQVSAAPGVLSDRGGAGMVSKNEKIYKLRQEALAARVAESAARTEEIRTWTKVFILLKGLKLAGKLAEAKLFHNLRSVETAAKLVIGVADIREEIKTLEP